MKLYKKSDIVKPSNEIIINKNGFNIINPTKDEILSDGWIEYKGEKLTNKEIIEQAKQNKIHEINEYDTSANVNNFKYKGINMWLPKNDRVGLMNSMSIEKENGKTTSIMWFNEIPLEVNIDDGIQLLKMIELYALQCYNITAKHKAEVKNLKTLKEIESFDVTKDYPQVLDLN